MTRTVDGRRTRPAPPARPRYRAVAPAPGPVPQTTYRLGGHVDRRQDRAARGTVYTAGTVRHRPHIRTGIRVAAVVTLMLLGMLCGGRILGGVLMSWMF